MSKFRINEINGIKVDEVIRCQFCGEEMLLVMTRLGELSGITYNCEKCGTLAVFYNNRKRLIKGINAEIEYEEEM